MKNKPTSLVPIQNQGIVKVEKSIQITIKLVYNGIHRLFNEAFILLNSEQQLSDKVNYLFNCEHNTEYLNENCFQFKSKSKEEVEKAIDLLNQILSEHTNHMFSLLLRSFGFNTFDFRKYF